MAPSRQATAAFLVAAALSALIWALSPLLTGGAEPWDSDGFYYLISLGLAGLAAGGLVPRPIWAR